MLRLYPQRFRASYEEQLCQTLIDCHDEQQDPGVWFWVSIFADLAASLGRERMRSSQAFLAKHAIAAYTAGLAICSTVMGLAATVTVQQMLRRGADQPQRQMVDYYSDKLAASPHEAAAAMRDLWAGKKEDLAGSLAPFAVIYDKHGNPRGATAFLDSSVPVPPASVFKYVRDFGSEAFTWSPKPGVRIAAVVRRVTGPQSGFVLAGRSLREVEVYESLLRKIAFGGWLVVLSLLAGGGFLLHRSQLREA